MEKGAFMSDQDLPGHARAVIVGGGIMGAGLAYHLAREGWGPQTVLLEKGELTSGSTWHAAGQITRSTSSLSLAKCVDYNISLYAGELERETGQSVTWHGCGSLRLAYLEDEADWLRQTLSVGRSLGFDMDMVGPDRIAELHPFYNLDGVIAALHTPDDGHVDPSGATMAMAAGARSLGARIIRGCRASGISRRGSGEWAVETERGTILCEHVVNAGGTYARQMGEWSDIVIPATSMTHHYFVTEPVPEFADLESELPVVRDDRKVSGYVRMEQRRGLIGIYEKADPNTVWIDHCPWECENWLFEPDYDRVAPWLEEALIRMPVLAARGIQRAVHGAISHPPDGNPLIGPAPGAPNYWCCCGTQIGVGWGPALTRELARWMVHGSADIGMREFDPRRFGPYATRDWQALKAREDYVLRHEIPFPHYNRLEGRPVRPSPLHDRLRDRGAVFEEVCGHERPRWFAKGGVAQRDVHSFRRSPVHDMVADEVAAVRERAGLMDITAFAKVEVRGAGADALLGRLCANRLPRRTGGVALAHMLNRRGRIELEATVMRLAESSLYIVCAAFFERRLLDLLAEATAPGGADAQILNHTDAWAALALNGPESRDILAEASGADLCNAAFPWLSAQRIEIAGQRMHAVRMSYAGELGWELHMPRDSALAAYDALIAAGEPRGLADYGSFAMNAMRMEKMYAGAGELNNEVTMHEAAVGRFARSELDYVGAAATRESAQRAERGELPWICAYLEIEPDGEFDGHGGEAVLLDGEVVGATSSVAYGHAVGKILAFAYVDPRASQPGSDVEVIVAGSPRPGRILGAPAYDPRNLRPGADAGERPEPSSAAHEGEEG